MVEQEYLPLSELGSGPPALGSPPTSAELRKMAALGLGMVQSGRASLMNSICARLLIPAGGFRGQSRLFVKGDVRLVGMLALMSRADAAKNIAANLERASHYTDTNPLLTLVTAAREHASALTAVSDKMIDSWREGGLDFLWQTKDLLGLPKSVTDAWARVPEFNSPETHHTVHPAYVPAHDQTLVYAAQISSSFRRNFGNHMQSEVGASSGALLAASSRIARLVWQEYSFLAPGGHRFDAKRSVWSQLGQGFGSGTALGYIVADARLKNSMGGASLDQIFKDPILNHTEWVRSAKTRVAETLFLERLLTTVRELRFPGD